MIVVLYWLNGLDNDPLIYGPFDCADEATRWATKQWGITATWGWELLRKPQEA